MSKLPDGWMAAQLGDLLAAIVGGGTPSKANTNYFQGSIPFMTVKDMHERFIADTQDHITEQALEDSASTLIPADTLVVASRMSLGKIARPQTPVAINQDLKALFLHEGFDKTYIEYAWRAKELQIQAMGTGTTVKGIRLEDIRGLEIPVAPSAEQTRIADKLGTLLARAQACNERIDAIPALLKRFRQAVLSAAICGDLTGDWRDGHECAHARELLERIQLDHHIAGGHAKGNAAEPTDGVHDLAAADQPPTWTVATLRDICEPGRPITYGILKPGPEVDDGVPYIRVADFPGNRLSLGSIRKTSPEIDAQFKRSRLRPGDIILSIRGTVGRVIEIPPELDGANITQDTARLAIGPRMVRKYVHFALLAEPTQRRMQMAVRGVAVKGINIGDVRALQVAVPPYDEQVEITTRIVKLFSLADQIEAGFNSARVQAQRLTPLLLAKAFRGELVPQDPADEPASTLLQRIAATQPTKVQASRGRLRIRPKQQSATPESAPTDWTSLPNGAWATPADPDGLASAVWLTAVLRAWGEPMPEREARLATLLCQQPRLFTAVLPAAQTTQWSRLVGDEARPLPAQVLRFQPTINALWGRAIKGMRARGDLVEAGFGDNITWALGPGAAGIETVGWPDGRAGFVVAYLRAHGIDSVLPLLEPSAQEFINVRAA